MKHPLLQVRAREGALTSLPELMAELGKRLAGRRSVRGAILGVRCVPHGQWVMDLAVGLVRGSSDSHEVDERDDVDLVLEGEEAALTTALNGGDPAGVTLRGDPKALEELLALL